MTEVLEYNLQAVSRNFSSREARRIPTCSDASREGHDEILLCILTVKEPKLEQVWMTHLFNLMDFDSFQPVTGIPPLGCIAGNSLASCFVFALLRHQDNL